MTAETWPAAGAHEDPKPQWVGDMQDRYLFADPSSAYSLHALIDPAIRQRWMQDAEARRDQRPRPWVIEYRTPVVAGVRWAGVVATNLPETTAAQAWARFEAVMEAHHGRLPAGARLVLLAAPGSAAVR